MGTKDAKAAKAGEKKKKKPAAVKLVGAVGCLVLAAVGGFVLAGRLSESTAAADGAPPTTTTAPEPQPGCATPPVEHEPAETVDLPPLNVNLADGHYLRVALSLALCADVVLEAEPEGSGLATAPALDIALAALSGRPMEELSTATGREEVKEHLTEQIMEAYPGVVADVFLIEFVMQ